MLYLDYHWDLSPGVMIPDPELNTDKLGWKTGDYWQVEEAPNGNKILRKVDPLVKFVLEGTQDGCS
jgi:hypothetical protein